MSLEQSERGSAILRGGGTGWRGRGGVLGDHVEALQGGVQGSLGEDFDWHGGHKAGEEDMGDGDSLT